MMDALNAMDTNHVISMNRRDMHQGMQAVVWFDNGYGASVVDHIGSYGVEMAVLHKYNPDDPFDFELCYSTPVTGDVLGHLTPDSLAQALSDVQALDRNDECSHDRPEDWYDDAAPFDEMFDSFMRLI